MWWKGRRTREGVDGERVVGASAGDVPVGSRDGLAGGARLPASFVLKGVEIGGVQFVPMEQVENLLTFLMVHGSDGLNWNKVNPDG